MGFKVNFGMGTPAPGWRLITGGYRDPISDVLRNPEVETVCFPEENGRYPARVPGIVPASFNSCSGFGSRGNL
jgi:hypothetical protein